MHASARKPALVLSLVAALLAALVLTLSPATPAYAAGNVGTLADGSAGFFRWLGDDAAANVADGKGVTGSASTKYLGSALATRELTSSPFSLNAMKTSLEILQACNECRAQEGLPALKVDTQLMAYSQVAAAWASYYQSDSSVHANPHAAFQEFGPQGKADAENIAYNYTTVDTAFWQWYTDEKEEHLAGNEAEAGHYLNIVNTSYRYFGAAYSKKVPSLYNTYEQTFGTRRRGLSYDVDTFIAKFNEYYALVTQTEPVEPPATSHDVTLVQPANGRLIEYSNSHDVGTWIVVYVEPDPGYEIESINVSGVDNVTISTDGENPNYKAAQFYMPDNDVTVSATIVKSGAGEDEGDNTGEGGSVFSDVADGDWYVEAVTFVYERGLMTGYAGTDRFGPGDFLNREQAATVLFRALGTGEKAPDCGLDDVEQGDWYAQAVNWAVSTGLITGYSNGSGLFGVGDALTRDQFAVIIARAAGADLSKVDLSALDGFSDGNKVAEWAAPAMAWAVRAGILTGSNDGHGGIELRPAYAINRAEMAAMIMRASLAGLL